MRTHLGVKLTSSVWQLYSSQIHQPLREKERERKSECVSQMDTHPNIPDLSLLHKRIWGSDSERSSICGFCQLSKSTSFQCQIEWENSFDFATNNNWVERRPYQLKPWKEKKTFTEIILSWFILTIHMIKTSETKGKWEKLMSYEMAQTNKTVNET